MPSTLSLITSMAMRQIYVALAAQFERTAGYEVDVIAAGGVDVTKRVRSGERFDVIALAADALHKLTGDGFVLAESCQDIARSPAALAVRKGSSKPANTGAALRSFVMAAPLVAVSSGPSGMAVRQLIRQWGSDAPATPKLVEAPPGVPVARLLARGEADIGVQQLSEMLHEPDIEIAGTIPSDILPPTIFSAGVGSAAKHRDVGQKLISAMRSAEMSRVLDQHGMEMA